MNVFDAVKEFHEKYEGDINLPITEKKLEFRLKLIDEEVEEFCNEVLELTSYFMEVIKQPKDINKVNLTKELADIIYVLVGFAVTFGLPLEKVFEEVHKSNMTKTLGNKREDGKILKGEDYVPPRLDYLFELDKEAGNTWDQLPSDSNVNA